MLGDIADDAACRFHAAYASMKGDVFRRLNYALDYARGDLVFTHIVSP
jgi:hypothetical protein